MLTAEELEVAAAATASYPAGHGGCWELSARLRAAEVVRALAEGHLLFDDC